jgi:glycosyltransferase involved in cell wall biosynthesis
MKPFFEKEACVETGDIYSPYLIIGRVFVGLSILLNLRTFIYFFMELFKAPITIKKQIETLKLEKPDIIHLNSSILFFVAISTKIAKIPLVWHVREVVIGSKWNLRKRFAGWFIRKLADEVICISEVEAKSLGQDTFNNANVVYNFIDLAKFNCSKDVIERIKKEYNQNNKNFFFSLGGVSFRKGTIEIIQTAKELKDDLFLIAGSSPTQNKYSLLKKLLITAIHKIEDLLKSLDLKKIYSWYYNQRVEFMFYDLNLENLKFVGKLDNVAPIISICDGLIFAGCTPHFPRPVYEAWALKKPVVVFKMEGISENIFDGMDGVICKSNDSIGLREALLQIENNMGEKGYEKAIEKFNMEKNVKKIIEIYERV